MKKLIVNPLFWLVLLIILFVLTGCAEAPKYTNRQCVIQLLGQTGENAVLANLFCEQEQPANTK